jgi:REP element-mobilizing transposase RayT
MPSYISMLAHFVWSTKNREPFILPSWRDDLYGYIGGILKNKRATLLERGGMADHIHLLVAMPSTLSLAEIVNVVKSNSSKWVHENIEQGKAFGWQERYGAFSVSKSAEPQVREYLVNQEEHHRVRPFKEEFVMFLNRHEIAYDERYLWD